MWASALLKTDLAPDQAIAGDGHPSPALISAIVLRRSDSERQTGQKFNRQSRLAPVHKA